MHFFSVFRSLAQHGLFSIFNYTLQNPDISIRIAANAIMSAMLDRDSSLVRSHCIAQTKRGDSCLFELIIDQFVKENDSGIRSQLADIIKVTLNMGDTQNEVNLFIKLQPAH